MDIFALTETSKKVDIAFIGSTGIYANKYFDSFERIDLNLNSLEFESTLDWN